MTSPCLGHADTKNTQALYSIQRKTQTPIHGYEADREQQSDIAYFALYFFSYPFGPAAWNQYIPFNLDPPYVTPRRILVARQLSTNSTILFGLRGCSYSVFHECFSLSPCSSLFHEDLSPEPSLISPPGRPSTHLHGLAYYQQHILRSDCASFFELHLLPKEHRPAAFRHATACLLCVLPQPHRRSPCEKIHCQHLSRPSDHSRITQNGLVSLERSRENKGRARPAGESCLLRSSTVSKQTQAGHLADPSRPCRHTQGNNHKTSSLLVLQE